jgi:hypothetical protein
MTASQLSMTLDQLRSATADGALVDLGGLMPEIERLCAQARHDPDPGRAAAELNDLARALEALHAELQRAAAMPPR